MTIRATQVTYIGDLVEMKRKMRPIVKETLQLAVRFWHRRNLKDHFKAGAADKYGYRQRGQRYKQRKRRVLGHSAPLVWSGATRQSAKRFIRTSGTSRRGVGEIQVPWYVRMIPTGRKAPIMGRELTATTPAEVKRIAEFVAVETGKRLNTIKARRTVRLG